MSYLKKKLIQKKKNALNNLSLYESEIKILFFNPKKVRNKNDKICDIEYLTLKPKKVYVIKNANIKMLSKYKFNTINNIFEISFFDLHNTSTNEIFNLYLVSNSKLFIFYSNNRKIDILPLWNGQDATIIHDSNNNNNNNNNFDNLDSKKDILTEFNSGIFIKVRSINKEIHPTNKMPIIRITGEQVMQ
ncbi:MAG: hypothetical protein U1E31_02740 [Rickettsiales bacterium]